MPRVSDNAAKTPGAERDQWMPQQGPQEKAIRASFVPELFFGGARGGGKTSFLIGDFAADVQEYGTAWRGIIFRKTYPELDEVVEEGKKVLYKAFPGTEYKVGVHEFRIPHATGHVILRLRHMETEGDADHYQGHSYAHISFDELTNWPDLKPYHKLKACLRSAEDIPCKRIRATGNPGGVGHNEVKRYYIDAGPQGELIRDTQSVMPRMWIRSLLSDNKILLKNDPLYIDRLKSVGDPELVRAWMEGDWEVSLGAFFSTWNSSVAVPSFEIPESWPLFGCMDYGESSPTAFYLVTVDYDGQIYFISEYYMGGAAASTHAYEIDKIISSCPFTGGRRPSIIYADPSMWVKRRLHEVVSQSPADVFSQQGLFLSKANNDRITGWRVINDALTNKRLYAFADWCPNLLRTMPTLPRSKSNPEDLDTKSEDHAADAARYGIMHVYQPTPTAPVVRKDPFLGTNLIKDLRTAHAESILN